MKQFVIQFGLSYKSSRVHTRFQVRVIGEYVCKSYSSVRLSLRTIRVRFDSSSSIRLSSRTIRVRFDSYSSGVVRELFEDNCMFLHVFKF